MCLIYTVFISIGFSFPFPLLILTYLYLFHTNLKEYAYQKNIYLQQREIIFKIMDIEKGKQQKSNRIK